MIAQHFYLLLNKAAAKKKTPPQYRKCYFKGIISREENSEICLSTIMLYRMILKFV